VCRVCGPAPVLEFGPYIKFEVARNKMVDVKFTAAVGTPTPLRWSHLFLSKRSCFIGLNDLFNIMAILRPIRAMK